MIDEWITLLETNDYLGVKKYIKEGADVNACTDHEESVLTIAIKNRCDDELIDLLIDAGADLDDFDDEGVGIFDVTITYNNHYLFEKMIARGQDVNSTYRRSRFTPLMAAVCYGRTELVQRLLEEGADTEAVDVKGFRAYDFARKMHKKKMMELLSPE